MADRRLYGGGWASNIVRGLLIVFADVVISILAGQVAMVALMLNRTLETASGSGQRIVRRERVDVRRHAQRPQDQKHGGQASSGRAGLEFSVHRRPP